MAHTKKEEGTTSIKSGWVREVIWLDLTLEITEYMFFIVFVFVKQGMTIG